MLQQHKTLPAEILERIFRELTIENVYTCQSVCRSWHIPAKRDFYKHVEFKTSFCISLFLSCISPRNESPLSTIPPPGIFVKRIFFNHAPTTSIMQNLSVGTTLSTKHIQALARQCPNVTIIDCTQNLGSLVVLGLLSLDDSISWKSLISFPDSKITQELYQQCSYKFRHSLQTFYFNMGPRGFDYLREFPCLNILDLSSAPISCINELESVLCSCKYLTQLVLTLRQSPRRTEPQQLSRLAVYPFLKSLKVGTDDDTFDGLFFEYIMYKFSRLLSLEICGKDILDTSLKDKAKYLRFIRWINTLKSSELVLIGHDYNITPQVVTEYLSGIFKTQSNTIQYNTTLNIHNTNHEMVNSNSTTFLVFSSMLISPSCIKRDIDIRLPDFETDDRLVHSNYISQFSACVNEIFISYEGTPVYNQGCNYFLGSIIEQCSILNSVNVNYCDLSLATNAINESITEFYISNSKISFDFFDTLSFCCPNLKHLTLHRNFHGRTPAYSFFLSMLHSDLETLSLYEEIEFPWIPIQGRDNNVPQELAIEVCTKINNRKRFFMLDTFTSKVTELNNIKQGSSRRVGNFDDNNINKIIGIQCYSIKRILISTSFADTTIDLY